MRALLPAVIVLTMFSFSAAQAEISAVQTQACRDPPGTPGGKCFKKAGARCDPTTHKWIGGDNTAFTSCLAAAGITGIYSDCIAGGQKMGYSATEASRYCSSRGLR